MSYFAYSKMSFKSMFAYKFELLLWTITTPIMLAVYYFLWRAIYSYTGQGLIRGFTFPELMVYFVLVEIVSLIIWENSDSWLADRVYNGDLIVALVRPIEVFFNRLFQRFGNILFFVPVNVSIMTAIGIFFFGLKIINYTFFALFIISLTISIFLFYSLSFLLGMSAFWLKKYSGIRMIKNGIFWLFGGGVLPLAFFPELVQKMFAFLPFQYMLYMPVQIFLGKFALAEAIRIILIQCIWVIALYAIIQMLWKRAMLRFSGVGV